MSARVVSFISEKGGVGKTTALYHIAVGLRRWHSLRVLALDADYQRGGLTGHLLPTLLEHFKKGAVPGTTLFHVFQTLYSGREELPRPDVHDTAQKVPLIPSDPNLTSVAVEKLPSSNNIRENNRMLFRHLSAVGLVLEDHLEDFDYVLIDTHPETSDLLRSVIYASDYAVSPVKLDELSSVGVPSAIEAVNGVNEDVKSLQPSLVLGGHYSPTEYVGAIGMMAREYSGALKRTERSQYRRLNSSGGVFDSYVTEGDGIRKAAERRVPVYDLPNANAKKQTEQFRSLVAEFLDRCP